MFPKKNVMVTFLSDPPSRKTSRLIFDITDFYVGVTGEMEDWALA